MLKNFNRPFALGASAIPFPTGLNWNDVYFKTPKGDTLINGGRMRVDLDMWGLLNNRVSLNQIELEHIRLNISRTLPDTTFNFQYILDAFDTGTASDRPEPSDTVSTPLAINLTGIALRDVRIKYKDDVTGADVNAYMDSLRASFSETDVDKSKYHLSTCSGKRPRRVYPIIRRLANAPQRSQQTRRYARPGSGKVAGE